MAWVSNWDTSFTSVTPVTLDGPVTDSISDVTDMTGVTLGSLREPDARVKTPNTLIRAKKKKGSVGSQPSQVCDRCRVDPTAAPCERCPLYGSWLERSGLSDDARIRDVYEHWVSIGGWRALWGAGKTRNRAIRAAQIAQVLALFPRVRERWPNYPSVAGER
jgi:hypothetical protein